MFNTPPLKGEYTKSIKYDERKRYYLLKAQKNKPLIDAELRELSESTLTQIRRAVLNTFGDGVPYESFSCIPNLGASGSSQRKGSVKSTAFTIEQTPGVPSNNFTVKGGAGLNDPAALFYNGWYLFLTEDITYNDQLSRINRGTKDSGFTESRLQQLSVPRDNRIDIVYLEFRLAEVSAESGLKKSEYFDDDIRDKVLGTASANRMRAVMDIRVLENAEGMEDGSFSKVVFQNKNDARKAEYIVTMPFFASGDDQNGNPVHRIPLAVLLRPGSSAVITNDGIFNILPNIDMRAFTNREITHRVNSGSYTHRTRPLNEITGESVYSMANQLWGEEDFEVSSTNHGVASWESVSAPSKDEGLTSKAFSSKSVTPRVLDSRGKFSMRSAFIGWDDFSITEERRNPAMRTGEPRLAHPDELHKGEHASIVGSTGSQRIGFSMDTILDYLNERDTIIGARKGNSRYFGNLLKVDRSYGSDLLVAPDSIIGTPSEKEGHGNFIFDGSGYQRKPFGGGRRTISSWESLSRKYAEIVEVHGSDNDTYASDFNFFAPTIPTIRTLTTRTNHGVDVRGTSLKNIPATSDNYRVVVGDQYSSVRFANGYFNSSSLLRIYNSIRLAANNSGDHIFEGYGGIENLLNAYTPGTANALLEINFGSIRNGYRPSKAERETSGSYEHRSIVRNDGDTIFNGTNYLMGSFRKITDSVARGGNRTSTDFENDGDLVHYEVAGHEWVENSENNTSTHHDTDGSLVGITRRVPSRFRPSFRGRYLTSLVGESGSYVSGNPYDRFKQILAGGVNFSEMLFGGLAIHPEEKHLDGDEATGFLSLYSNGAIDPVIEIGGGLYETRSGNVDLNLGFMAKKTASDSNITGGSTVFGPFDNITVSVGPDVYRGASSDSGSFKKLIDGNGDIARSLTGNSSGVFKRIKAHLRNDVDLILLDNDSSKDFVVEVGSFRTGRGSLVSGTGAFKNALVDKASIKSLESDTVDTNVSISGNRETLKGLSDRSSSIGLSWDEVFPIAVGSWESDYTDNAGDRFVSVDGDNKILSGEPRRAFLRRLSGITLGKSWVYGEQLIGTDPDFGRELPVGQAYALGDMPKGPFRDSNQRVGGYNHSRSSVNSGHKYKEWGAVILTRNGFGEINGKGRSSSGSIPFFAIRGETNSRVPENLQEFITDFAGYKKSSGTADYESLHFGGRGYRKIFFDKAEDIDNLEVIIDGNLTVDVLKARVVEADDIKLGDDLTVESELAVKQRIVFGPGASVGKVDSGDSGSTDIVDVTGELFVLEHGVSNSGDGVANETLIGIRKTIPSSPVGSGVLKQTVDGFNQAESFVLNGDESYQIPGNVRYLTINNGQSRLSHNIPGGIALKDFNVSDASFTLNSSKNYKGASRFAYVSDTDSKVSKDPSQELIRVIVQESVAEIWVDVPESINAVSLFGSSWSDKYPITPKPGIGFEFDYYKYPNVETDKMSIGANSPFLPMSFGMRSRFFGDVEGANYLNLPVRVDLSVRARNTNNSDLSNIDFVSGSNDLLPFKIDTKSLFVSQADIPAVNLGSINNNSAVSGYNLAFCRDTKGGLTFPLTPRFVENYAVNKYVRPRFAYETFVNDGFNLRYETGGSLQYLAKKFTHSATSITRATPYVSADGPTLRLATRTEISAVSQGYVAAIPSRIKNAWGTLSRPMAIESETTHGYKSIAIRVRKGDGTRLLTFNRKLNAVSYKEDGIRSESGQPLCFEVNLEQSPNLSSPQISRNGLRFFSAGYADAMGLEYYRIGSTGTADYYGNDSSSTYGDGYSTADVEYAAAWTYLDTNSDGTTDLAYLSYGSIVAENPNGTYSSGYNGSVTMFKAVKNPDALFWAMSASACKIVTGAFDGVISDFLGSSYVAVLGVVKTSVSFDINGNIIDADNGSSIFDMDGPETNHERKARTSFWVMAEVSGNVDKDGDVELIRVDVEHSLLYVNSKITYAGAKVSYSRPLPGDDAVIQMTSGRVVSNGNSSNEALSKLGFTEGPLVSEGSRFYYPGKVLMDEYGESDGSLYIAKLVLGGDLYTDYRSSDMSIDAGDIPEFSVDLDPSSLTAFNTFRSLSIPVTDVYTSDTAAGFDSMFSVFGLVSDSENLSSIANVHLAATYDNKALLTIDVPGDRAFGLLRSNDTLVVTYSISGSKMTITPVRSIEPLSVESSFFSEDATSQYLVPKIGETASISTGSISLDYGGDRGITKATSVSMVPKYKSKTVLGNGKVRHSWIVDLCVINDNTVLGSETVSIVNDMSGWVEFPVSRKIDGTEIIKSGSIEFV